MVVAEGGAWHTACEPRATHRQPDRARECKHLVVKELFAEALCNATCARQHPRVEGGVSGHNTRVWREASVLFTRDLSARSRLDLGSI